MRFRLDRAWREAKQQAALNAADDNQCQSFGSKLGTDAYTACRMQLTQIHSNEAIATADIDQRHRAALGQAFQQAGQNFQNAMKQPQQIQVITPTRFTWYDRCQAMGVTAGVTNSKLDAHASTQWPASKLTNGSALQRLCFGTSLLEVRFVPLSGPSRRRDECPLSANSGYRN